MWLHIVHFEDKLYLDGKEVNSISVNGEITKILILDKEQLWMQIQSKGD